MHHVNASSCDPPGDYRPRYIVTQYSNGSMCTWTVDRDAAEQLAQQRDVDFQVDTVFGHMFVRHADGLISECGYRLPGIGPRRLSVLFLLMKTLAAMTAHEVYVALDDDVFADEGNLAAAIKALRKGLGDSAAAPRFLHTARLPGRVWWDKLHSYRVIEPLLDSGDGDPTSGRFHIDGCGPQEFVA